MAPSAAIRWLLPGWARRTQVERVEFYTRSSLFFLLWFLLGVAALGTANVDGRPTAIVGVGLVSLALGLSSTATLRQAMRLYPAFAPLPRTQLAVLTVLVVVAECLVFLLKEDAQFPGSLLVLGSLVWGAGGLRDRRLQWVLYVASPLLVFLPTGNIGLGAYGLFMGLFLIFTVQSSLWLLGVVNELDEARGNQAALAVAEERLRFSRDVHDVMGRRLSTIAVQSELAATLAERGDDRTSERILAVRDTAHEALREARQLAYGYRPLDLAHEVEGAISLLRSAGISATADLDDLPESVARTGGAGDPRVRDERAAPLARDPRHDDVRRRRGRAPQRRRRHPRPGSPRAPVCARSRSTWHRSARGSRCARWTTSSSSPCAWSANPPSRKAAR